MPDHRLEAFECASESQTRWLRETARRAVEAGTSRVYVVTPAPGDLDVIGYYALSAAGLARASATPSILKGAGRYDSVPAILLGRLGVHREYERQGIGRLLVKDALWKAADAADLIGARVLVINAETRDARDFYLGIAEFQASPTDELDLLMKIRDIRRGTE